MVEGTRHVLAMLQNIIFISHPAIYSHMIFSLSLHSSSFALECPLDEVL